MKLYYYCSSCQKENSFKTTATNRFDLQKERGNFINERFKKCGTIVKRRINRVHAKPNKWLLIMGTLFCIVFTVILFFFVPVIVIALTNSIVFSIPFIAWREQDKKASTFNKVMVSDG